MRTTHILILCLLMCLFFGHPLNAQTCGPEPEVDQGGFVGSTFFNYGSIARSKSNTYKTAAAIGQVLVGYTEGLAYNTSLGFYSRFLLPPFALKVNATQGDLLDRIQITWEIDALGPSPSGGFNIYRDGSIIASFDDPNIRSFNDFNVVAGRPYTYTVRGKNIFGEGAPSDAIGFQVPNGVVTGWISTLNGSAVPGATVTLTPMQGFSAKFDAGDGAITMADPTSTPFLPDLDSNWTMTFWMKTDTSIGNGKIIGMIGIDSSLYIRARQTPNNGIAIAKTPGGTALLVGDFKNGTKHNWHHIALTYDGMGHKYRLYFEGGLVATATSSPLPPPDTIKFGALAGSGTWKGRLDELRFYHHKLDELDFDGIMEGTASSETPYLSHYWKFDEELGVKSYDIVRRQKLYFCGANFDPDRPPVHTAGITNEDGYYKIESASYGDGTTFLAQPKKNFYKHRSLKFERAESDYATLPDFPITPEATIEVWVNSAGPNGFQCILAKQFGTSEFRIVLDGSNGIDNNINVHLNGTTQSFGVLGSGYQHLAFTWDSTTQVIKGYKNGLPLTTVNPYPMTPGDWSDPAHPWLLGKQSNNTTYFDGLIDEVAFYDTILTQALIQNHFQQDRTLQEAGLRVYFPLDEGSGNKITNSGSVLLDGGTTTGTEWSPLATHQVTTPHVFAPATRQVTLNPSVTSVDQVDFTDRSTVAVTGYVRYKNTDCFAANVEILVNGQTFTPKIVTDSTGKFVIDFDPGTTATLKPVFDNHVFIPATWQITNVTSPVAGLLFNDITTHKITGKVKGGELGVCEKNITPPAAECIVEVSSADGCLKRNVTLNGSGTFSFTGLPPLEKMQIAIIKHNDPDIRKDFDNQGGYVVDISKKDTVVNFFYVAPPEVEIVSGLQTLSTQCPKILLSQFDPVHLQIKLKEHYFGGVCEIDTAHFEIINGFGDEVLDTAMGNKLLQYNFDVGTPNPSPPFNKTLQIIGTKIDDDVEASLTVSAIVLGIKAHENTFTTLMPEIPTLILRDPPGDGSYSYLEKDEQFCSSNTLINELETDIGGTVKLFVGPKEEWIIAPLGLGSIIDIAGDSYIGVGGAVNIKRTGNTSFETCTSFDTRISTNDDDLIVGGEQGGDLYMGTAVNIVYGNVDIISFDTMACEGYDDTGFMVQPGDFATTFIYSEFYILNTLIPSLKGLKDDEETSDEDSLRYAESIERWDSIIALNHRQKENAHILKNISFDAGIEYEYSETSDTTTTEELEEITTGEVEFATEFKITILEVGVGGDFHIKTNTGGGTRDESGHRKGITAGYVLKDNDPLDAFSVDVGMDSLYKTPVFDIKAGQSSCPWEPGTANREGTNLAMFPGFSQTVLNVPANEPAVFKFNLGNTSATHEDWVYSFVSPAANNPDGAIIRMGALSLATPVDIPVKYGQSVPVTVTVNRGPIEYNYDHLLVAEISQCEYDRHLALAIKVDDDPNFFSGRDLSVHFIRPCSEVNITSPRQNWVVFPDPETDAMINDNLVHITVSGYDTLSRDFEGIRCQYRAADGNGAWINIEGEYELFNPHWKDIHPADPRLGDRYSIFTWDTDMLEDGEYEIRALTVCGNTIPNENGYSEIIKGRIDRQPPSIVGVPQPSDGVYQVGDEISFTFNQPINCDDINPVDDVKLFKSPNEPIDIAITCVDNKIVITPTWQNVDLENAYLRAEIHGVKDLTGNEFVYNGMIYNHGKWEFYVDRNELAWLTDSVGITKYQDEEKSINVKIHNRGGYPVPFTINNIPDGVHVTPNAGTLVANEIRDIQITAADTLDLGWFKDSIYLTTVTGNNPFFMGGVEKLPFDVRNICRPPDWTVNPALYQQTMTFCLRIKINNGPFSNDPEDQIGAFIDGQLRGVAKLTNTSVPVPDTWVAFLTVYGNTADAGKDVIFELFDADACLHYPAKFAGGDTVAFTSNGIQGSPGGPRTLINSSYLIHEIPVKTGWNWISFNLGFPNPAINTVLNNIPFPTGDLIKDQTQFSIYNNNTWAGSLATLGNESLYMYQAAQPKTIKITGNALTPASVPLTINPGWNWIGYIPDDRIPINTALASLAATAGDIIKSQTGFAQYVNNTTKWIGNLTHLDAPNGYLLKSLNGGTLTYPASFTGDDLPQSRSENSISSFWKVDAAKYEFNMTLIGDFEYQQTNATTSGMELGAFVGDELRGAGEAVYVEFLEKYMFFLTVFANTSGEQVHFKLYDPVTGEVQPLNEKMSFSPNYHQGSIEDPVPFSLQTTGIGDVESELSFNVQPNPFRDETVCRIELPAAQKVNLIVSDLDGKTLYFTKIEGNAGMNSFIWKGCSTKGAPLTNGIYLIRMETDQGLLTKKVVLQR